MTVETVSWSFFSALVTMHAAASGRQRERLVDVDADAVDAFLGAGRLEHADTGTARDLEDHVGALVEHLGGDLGAALGIVEADDRVGVGLDVQDLDVRVDRPCAVDVAVAEGDDRRHVGAADGADDARLAERRGDDADEVARLGLGER